MDEPDDSRAERRAWRDVALRARELSLAPGGADGGVASPETAQQLARWIDRSSRGDRAIFEKRLAWDGLGVADAVGGLSPRSEDPEGAPAWWASFAGLQRAWGRFHELYPSFASKRAVASGITRRELPFQELFVPAALAVKRALLERHPSVPTVFTENALRQIERTVLRDLCSIADDVLELEFSVFRQQRDGGAFPGLAPPAESSSEAYEAFVQGLYDQDLLPLFAEYSVLARVLSVTVEVWLDSLGELSRRVHDDAAALAAVFCGTGTELGKVRSIKLGLSDRHRRGRSVAILEFESGTTVVYKPKALDLEQLFYGLLRWINEQDCLPHFKCPKLVARGEYGWAEYIDHQECSSRSEVASYYERLGALLAVLYAVRGTDVHAENIIAHGSQPVVVDLETLLSPRLGGRPVVGPAALRLLGDPCDSVLGTGLLPSWRFEGARGWYDPSGMGGMNETTAEVRYWENANRDGMVIKRRKEAAVSARNLPLHHGKPQWPQPHVTSFTEGFRRAYRLLRERAAELLRPGGLLAATAGMQSRFVFRPTSVYANLLVRLKHPDHLRLGVDRSIELALLDQAFNNFDERSPFWSVVAHERRALEYRDIPIFHCSVHGKDVLMDNEVIARDCFMQSGYEAVTQGLEALGPNDEQQQVSVIRAAVLAYAEPATGSGRSREAGPLQPGEAVTEALAIARQLRERMVRLDDGAATWFGLRHGDNPEAFHLAPIGIGLYDGTLGVAVFAAALDKVTGGCEDARALLAAVTESILPSATLAREAKGPPWSSLGLGEGLGSILYAFALIDALIENGRYLEAALRFGADAAIAARIRADEQLDVMAGSAGLLLGCLAVHQLAGDDQSLATAVACGDRLRASRPFVDGVATGVAHGAAGYALALSRLSQSAHDGAYQALADEAVAAENRRFSTSTGGWLYEYAGPDDHVREFARNWCHGSAGIGLVRLALSNVDRRPETLLEDVERALTDCGTPSMSKVDQLCCGNAGRLELLLSAGVALERPALVESALARAGTLVCEAHERGGYRYFANLPPGVVHPGFFQGLSGLGYQLLRLTHPHVVPNVLVASVRPPTACPASTRPQTTPLQPGGR